MNTRILALVAYLSLLAAGLAGCGGGGGGSSAVTPSLISGVVSGPTGGSAGTAPATGGPVSAPNASASPGTVAAQSTKTNVIIVIAPPADIIAQAISRKVAAARHAQFVSPGTNGVQLTVSQGATQIASSVADVSSGSSLCATTNGSRTCTVPLNVASGTYTFGLTSYNQSPSGGAIPGTAQQLGNAIASATVLVGQTNQINFYIGAVVSSVGIGTQGNTSAYSSLPADGNVHNYAVSIVATDASGNPIAGSSSSLANPVTATLAESGGSGHAHLVYNGSASGTVATVTHASDSLSIAYDGGGSAGYSMTITFTASGAPTSTLTVSPMFVAGDSKYTAGHVLFTATGQSEPFSISETGAPGSVVYTSSGAVCPALPSGSNPQLALPLTGSISGSSASASMTITDNIAPQTTTGCSATIADNLGTAITVPISLPAGTAVAASTVAGTQIDPTHYSSGTSATFTVTQGGNAVTALSVHQSAPSTITVSEVEDTTAPVVTPTGCSNIVTVASSLSQGTWSSSAMGSLSGTITLISLASGSCTLTIADGNGQSQTLSLTASVSGAVTQFGPLSISIVTHNGSNDTMIVGPDNNIWALESISPSILAVITPSTGAFVEHTVSVTHNPIQSIASGFDGYIYAIEADDKTFAKISTSGALVSEGTDTSGYTDFRIARGISSLYVLQTSPGNGGYSGGCPTYGAAGVGTLNTTTMQTTFVAGFAAGGGYAGADCGVGNVVNTQIEALTWYSSGQVFFVASIQDGGNGNVNWTYPYDPENGFFVTPNPNGFNSYTCPYNAAGEDSAGNGWGYLSSACNGYTLYKNGTGVSNSTMYGMTIGPDGNAWVAASCGGQNCFQDFGSTTKAYYTNGLHAAPSVMIVGPDNNIWFSENGSPYFGYVSP